MSYGRHRAGGKSNWKITSAKGLLVYFGADFAPANATAEEKAAAHHLQMEKSYQVHQALISVGSGGLWGKGWHKGNQTALGFLPPGAAHNDFISPSLPRRKDSSAALRC